MSSFSLSQKNEHPHGLLAFSHLQRKNLIFPGSIIKKYDVEAALDIQYKDKDDWEFLGKYLLLKTKIESEGFFITQKDLDPPEFRILTTEEMSAHAYHKLLKNLASNFKIGYIMAAHDVSKLNDEGRRKHKAVQLQAANAALHQQKTLLDNSFF